MVKSPSEIREKKRRIKEKLSIRQVGKTTPKEKKEATGEFELFKKIALEKSYIYSDSGDRCVLAKHINPQGLTYFNKQIRLDDLTVTNFSHIIGKGRDKTKRLDPENIEIVSRAYHEWQHTKQIAQVSYPN